MTRNNNKTILVIGIIILLLIVLSIYYRAIDKKQDMARAKSLTHLNLVVLLDLSNRIDPKLHPFQADKDLKLIRELLNHFENSVRQKLYMHARDRFIITVAPQTSNYEPLLHQIGDSLVIDMSRLNMPGKPGFEQQKRKLLTNLEKLYAAATQNSTYRGADVWAFFRDYLQSYIISGEAQLSYKNYLIILTDGYLDFDRNLQNERPQSGNQTTYMQVDRLRHRTDLPSYFSSQKFGLIPACEGLDQLSILLMEINLRHLKDRPVLETYWFDWFRKMNVGSAKMMLSDYSSESMKMAISEFFREN